VRALRDSLATMGPREGSRFTPFAEALRTATAHDEPADAGGRAVVTDALKNLFHLEL
jgi:hypothetical protein